MPDDMTPPEGMTIPQDGEMPSFGGGMPNFNGGMPNFGGGMGAGFGNFSSDMETTEVEIGDAHISVEIEGGKASGSMSDLKAGTFVTITMNGKGKVTNVLIFSQSFFGGGRYAN